MFYLYYYSFSHFFVTCVILLFYYFIIEDIILNVFIFPIFIFFLFITGVQYFVEKFMAKNQTVDRSIYHHVRTAENNFVSIFTSLNICSLILLSHFVVSPVSLFSFPFFLFSFFLYLLIFFSFVSKFDFMDVLVLFNFILFYYVLFISI